MGGAKADTGSFCASEACIQGCPQLKALEHNGCACPASCAISMSAAFGTKDYLDTVWKNCNRMDNACDDCPQCEGFDPSCPAACIAPSQCDSTPACASCEMCNQEAPCPDWCEEEQEGCPSSVDM